MKDWEKLAKKDGILVLVQPDVDDGYQITSRSINNLVIPKDNKNQDFRHASGFMAVYPNRDTAIHMAQHIINRYSI